MMSARQVRELRKLLETDHSLTEQRFSQHDHYEDLARLQRLEGQLEILKQVLEG